MCYSSRPRWSEVVEQRTYLSDETKWQGEGLLGSCHSEPVKALKTQWYHGQPTFTSPQSPGRDKKKAHRLSRVLRPRDQKKASWFQVQIVLIYLIQQSQSDCIVGVKVCITSRCTCGPLHRVKVMSHQWGFQSGDLLLLVVNSNCLRLQSQWAQRKLGLWLVKS